MLRCSICSFILLAASVASSAVYTFRVDDTASFSTAHVDYVINGNIYSSQEYAPGSATAPISGSFEVDITDTTIDFRNQGTLTLEDTHELASPPFPSGEFGSSTVFINMPNGSVSHLTLQEYSYLLSTDQLTLTGPAQSQFSGDITVTGASGNRIAWNSNDISPSILPLTGFPLIYDITSGTLEDLPGNVTKLTIVANTLFQFPLIDGTLVRLTFDSVVVATVPEVSAFWFAIGVVAIFFASVGSRRLFKATTKSPAIAGPFHATA